MFIFKSRKKGYFFGACDVALRKEERVIYPQLDIELQEEIEDSDIHPAQQQRSIAIRDAFCRLVLNIS
tara:strand:+ start:262 stop:465 length:204 start_codon:yes stop_codon:yes gene_type:complete